MKTKTLFAGIAVLTFIGQSNLHAQATWTGVGVSGTPVQWSVGSNWSANPPANGDTISLLFNNTAANSFSDNNLTGLTVTGISIPATFGGVNVKDNTITGNAITLSGGVTVATGNYQTIGLNIALTSGSGSFSQSTGQTTFSGQISGAEAISKTGGGTVVFSGPNNFSGNVTVSGGALSVTHDSGLGTSAGKTTANGGSLQLSNNVTITGETLEIAGNGGSNTTGAFRNNSGNNTWTGSINTIGNDSRILAAAGTLTISGVISSTNSNNNQVIFRGEGGTIELTNANSYGGTTRLFGTASNAATVPMLRLSGGDNRLPTGTTIDIGGGLVSGSMEIVGVSQEVAGLVSNGGATTSKISGSGTATLVVNNSATGSFTGTLTDSLAFTKTGAASYTLSGNNTYSRGTTINGGTLKVAHAAALGIGTVNLNAGSGAVLQLATDTSVNAYNLTMGSNRFNTIVSDKATASTAGIVHTLGTLSLGASTLTINKGSNATGTTAGVSFTAVDLSAGNNDRNVILNGDGVISLGSVAALSNNIGFTGGQGNGGTVADKVLQLDGTNASNAVTGVISNTNSTGSTVVSLIKANSSTWNLAAANTYTGDTTIQAGTLALGVDGTIANSPKIIVGDAGSSGAVLDVSAKTGGFTIGGAQTLSGIGTVDANAGGTLRDVTIQGTHAPGNSTGIQTVDGNLSYASSSIFEWELTANTATQGTSPNSTFDQVNVAGGGTLAIASDAKFRVILNSSGSDVDFTQGFWSTDQSWNIFTGASALTGFTLDSVSNDKNGVAFTANHPNGHFTITGSTLTWNAVPEPTSALVGLLVTAGLLRRRRCA